MRKQLFIIAMLAVIGLSARGQWAPTGASWHYQSGDIFMNNWYADLQSTGDTLIQGKNCKIIQSNGVGTCNYNTNNSDIFLHAENDAVYYFSRELNKYCLLYDFSKIAGDTFYIKSDIPVNLVDSVGFIIDSIGSITIGTKDLRVQYVSAIENSGCTFNGMSGQIIENIGHTYYLFPVYLECCDASFTGSLLCYKDTLLNYNGPGVSPNFCNTIGINEAKTGTPSTSLFPNPATTAITLETPRQSAITITNIQGQIIKTLATGSNKTNIDISGFAKGLYFLRVQDDDGVAVRRFVKE